MPAQRPSSSGGAKKPTMSTRAKKQAGVKAPKAKREYYVDGPKRTSAGGRLEKREKQYLAALKKDKAARVLRDKQGPKPTWANPTGATQHRRSSTGR